MSKKFVLLFTFITILLCAPIYFNNSCENADKLEHNVNICVLKSGSLKCDETNYVAPVRFFAYLASLLFVTLLVQVVAHVHKTYLWKVELPVFWGAKYRIQSPRCKITNKYSNLFLDFLWLL